MVGPLYGRVSRNLGANPSLTSRFQAAAKDRLMLNRIHLIFRRSLHKRW